MKFPLSDDRFGSQEETHFWVIMKEVQFPKSDASEETTWIRKRMLLRIPLMTLCGPADINAL